MTPAPPGPVERTCGGCGYSLRGLAPGRRCPECGLIAIPSAAHQTPISEMPPSLVDRVRFAAWLVTGWVAVVGARVVWPGLAESVVAHTIDLALAAVGVVVVWLLTRPVESAAGIAQGFGPAAKLRIATRWLSLWWIVVVVAASYAAVHAASRQAAVPPRPADWLDDTLQVVTLVAGLGGLVAVATLLVLLQRLALWVRDDTAYAAFSVTLWGTPLAVVLGAAGVGVFLIGLLIAGLWLAAILAFPFGLLSLSRSLDWASRHARERIERLDRQAARRARYDADVADSVRRMDASGGSGEGS